MAIPEVNSTMMSFGDLNGYRDNEFGYLVSPPLDFSNWNAQNATAYITLDIHLLTEENYDGVYLEYSIDNGVTWTFFGKNGEFYNDYMSPYGNLPMFGADEESDDDGMHSFFGGGRGGGMPSGPPCRPSM